MRNTMKECCRRLMAVAAVVCSMATPASAQEDAYYESRYDTGRPSILGDILKTAAGVALGNKLSEKLDKKDKR